MRTTARGLGPGRITARAGDVADFTPNALRVLEARYLRRDADRRVIEHSADLIPRVARAVAQTELRLGTASTSRSATPPRVASDRSCRS
jgi:ribonucleotide reductase alpha subunit